MEHVSITLPLELKTRAETLAREEGVSLEEFVRELLAERVLLKPAEHDLFFAKYKTFDGDTPADFAENHDKYLYDDE